MITRRLVPLIWIALALLPIYAPQAAAQATLPPVGTIPITPDNAPQVTLLDELQNPGGEAVNAAVYNPDGAWIATSSDDTTIRLWPQDGEQTESVTLEGHTGPVVALAFSPDGSRLASAGGDGDSTVRLWDVAAHAESMTLASMQVASLAFSPDGAFLAAGGTAGSVRVWDTETGAVTGDLDTSGDTVRGLAFSPDGSRLSAAGSDGAINVWTVTTGSDGSLTFSDPQELDRHQGGACSLAFSPDGSRLASGGADQTVRVWDATSGDELAALSGHTGTVTSVVFSPDGSLLASGGDDATVHVWDAASGESLAVLGWHTGAVAQVSFSPDGARLVSAGGDGIAAVWGIGEPASDEVVAALFHENAAALEAEDLDRYMATINPESPNYRPTADIMRDLFERYDLRITIDDLKILGRTNNQITVQIVQTTTSRAPSDFSANRQTTINMLRQYRGRWRISETVVIGTEFFE